MWMSSFFWLRMSIAVNAQGNFTIGVAKIQCKLSVDQENYSLSKLRKLVIINLNES